MSPDSLRSSPTEAAEVEALRRENPMLGGETSPDQVPALAALLASDNAGTAVVLQVTTNLVIASATYLTASFALVLARDVPSVVLLLLPVPVLGLQMLQMVLGASAVWRARSAAVFEARLLNVVGADEAMRQRLGSVLSSMISDPKYIAHSGRGRRVRAAAAILPYNIFYTVGLAYTLFMAIQGTLQMDATWPRVAAGGISLLVYGALWFVLIRGALINFSDDWEAVLPRADRDPSSENGGRLGDTQTPTPLP